MGHKFEDHREVTVPATPEQVWEAIATGPGIDSWFMGRNQVQPGEGGTVATVFGDYRPVGTIGAWDPPRRFGHHIEPAEDGRTIAYEFLVEGRSGGSTALRLVVGGFLPGDDWETEYEAMTHGGDLFFATLATCLTYFPGRTATPVTAFGPPVTDWPATWAALRRGLGLAAPAAAGSRVRFIPAGLPPVDGVVYAANPQTIGIRTGAGLFRFLQGFHGPLIAAHHLFGTVDPGTEPAWQAWLARLGT